MIEINENQSLLDISRYNYDVMLTVKYIGKNMNIYY